MKRDNPFAVIDIGSSKVCVIVARINRFERIERLGMGLVEVKSGNIIKNIPQIAQVIRESVEKAEYESRIKIQQINVGISGKGIYGENRNVIYTRKDPDKEITEKEVYEMQGNIYRQKYDSNYRIISAFSQKYIIDNERSLKNPVGNTGEKLEGRFYVTYAKNDVVSTLSKSLKKSGIDIENTFLSSLCSGTAVIGKDESDRGIAVLDIGSETVDIVIYIEDMLQHVSVIPFGGRHITYDIAKVFNLSYDDAEMLKIKYGCAIPNSSSENVKIPIHSKQIPLDYLNDVIYARIDEIFEYAKFKLQNYLAYLSAGIVITGGGSKLNKLGDLLAKKFDSMSVRINKENNFVAPEDDVLKDPVYSVVTGMMLRCVEDRGNTYHYSENSGFSTKKFLSKGKGILQRMKGMLLDE